MTTNNTERTIATMTTRNVKKETVKGEPDKINCVVIEEKQTGRMLPYKKMNESLSLEVLPSLMPANEVAQNIVVIPAFKPETIKAIPKCEEAVDTDIVINDMNKIRNLGFFSPIKGMHLIKNAVRDMISARIYEDEKGYRYVEYVQEYSNHILSPIMSVKLSSMRILARWNFVLEDIEETRVRKAMEKFLLNAIDDYHGKFRGPIGDELEVKEILNALYWSSDRLPVISDMEEYQSGEPFYYNVMDKLHQLAGYVRFSQYKSYYPLDDTTISDLASSLEMKKMELLKKLKQEGFLYLPPSSRGYQTNVRVKNNDGSTDTQWMYCIWKLSYFAEVEEYISKDMLPENF